MAYFRGVEITIQTWVRQVALVSSRISSWDDIAQNSKREEAKVVGVFATKHIQSNCSKKSALSRFDPVVDSRLVSRCLPPIPLQKQDFNRLPVYHLFAMVFYPCWMYLHPKLICLCICASSEESWTEWPMTHLPIWVNTKDSKLGLAFHIPTSWCWGTFCWFVPAERSKLTHAQPWWASLGIPWCTPWRRWTPVCLTMFDP